MNNHLSIVETHAKFGVQAPKDVMPQYANTAPNAGFDRFIKDSGRDHFQAMSQVPDLQADLRAVLSKIHGILIWLNRLQAGPTVARSLLTRRPSASWDTLSQITWPDAGELSTILRAHKLRSALNEANRVWGYLEIGLVSRLQASRYWQETLEGRRRWIGNQSIAELVAKDLADTQNRISGMIPASLLPAELRPPQPPT